MNSKRKLIDVEMEQTGETNRRINRIASSSMRDANSSMVESRMKNQATGQSWFDAPSQEFQSYENKKLDRGLSDRQSIGNQDINQERRILTELQPLANNEANRALGMSLATQFPYKKYENESSSARDIMNSSLGAIPTFLNRATASRLNPVSMSL